MKPREAKAKGRLLQNKVAEMIRERFKLSVDDCNPAIMSAGGVDINLSTAAQLHLPLAIECKNQKRLALPEWMRQAKRHAANKGLLPAVIYKEHYGKDPYIVLRFKDFLELLPDD